MGSSRRARPTLGALAIALLGGMARAAAPECSADQYTTFVSTAEALGSECDDLIERYNQYQVEEAIPATATGEDFTPSTTVLCRCLNSFGQADAQILNCKLEDTSTEITLHQQRASCLVRGDTDNSISAVSFEWLLHQVSCGGTRSELDGYSPITGGYGVDGCAYACLADVGCEHFSHAYVQNSTGHSVSSCYRESTCATNHTDGAQNLFKNVLADGVSRKVWTENNAGNRRLVDVLSTDSAPTQICRGDQLKAEDGVCKGLAGDEACGSFESKECLLALDCATDISPAQACAGVSVPHVTQADIPDATDVQTAEQILDREIVTVLPEGWSCLGDSDHCAHTVPRG